MKIQYHAATAIPFLCTGHYIAAATCLLPDLPWLPVEAMYRADCGTFNTRPPWHSWIKGVRHGLIPYRYAHSLLLVLFVCLLSVLVGNMPEWPYVAAAWLLHIVLDLFSHDGPMRARPFYPLPWKWPWVLKPFRYGTEEGQVHVVLLSGGWESSACLAMAVDRAARTGATVEALFFDYGQPYLEQELHAVHRLAHHFRVDLHELTLPPLGRDGKVFQDRNASFITIAGGHGRTVWFGCRAPFPAVDQYGDANWFFAKSFGQHPRVWCPLILHPKWLVKWRAVQLGVPAGMVFSSEGWAYDKETT